MYIVKNALRCIGRAKGRNVLIGIIVLVIAVSACIGLSIRQASESAKEEALSNLSITGTISFDRKSMMSEMGNPPEEGERGEFDRSKFKEMMGNSSSLTLEEYQTYAEAESVKDFYYSLTANVNGSDEFEPVSSETEDETEETSEDTSEDTQDMSQMGGMGFPGGMGGMGGMPPMM